MQHGIFKVLPNFFLVIQTLYHGYKNIDLSINQFSTKYDLCLTGINIIEISNKILEVFKGLYRTNTIIFEDSENGFMTPD